MSTQKVSVVLLSWKRPNNMQRIVDHLRTHDFLDDIIIWNNNPEVELQIQDENTTIINSATNVKTLGRFLAVYHTKHENIYTQDDDCIVGDIQTLLQKFLEDPSRIAHGLREDHFNDQGQFNFDIAHVAYMGWGGIFQKKWLSVFDMYTEKFGKDALLQSKADRVFSMLMQQKHNAMLMPIENLDGSRGPEAIWTQPEFYKETQKAEQRVLSLLGKEVAPSPQTSRQKAEKFVILTTPRTGSNFLVEILGKNPDVHCYGELYNYTSMHSTFSMEPEEQMCDMTWRNAHPLTFLENVWKQNHGKASTGFKLFFEQNMIVKERLCEDASVKKIVLRRKNIVRQFVSLRIALENQKWGVRKPQDLVRAKIAIDTEALKSFANISHLHYAAARKKMQETGQEYLEITYEDLFGEGQEQCFAEICTFLGISPALKPTSSLLKQNPEPLADIVENFAQVKKELKGTVYEPMLLGDELSLQNAEKPQQIGAFKKFAIVGTPRTGSTCLVGLLNQHPKIGCFYEVFNQRRISASQGASMGLTEEENTLSWKSKNVPECFRRMWNSGYNDRIGFKIFLSQLPEAIDHTMKDRSVGKILLQRNNILRQYVSLKIAERDANWVIQNAAPKKPLPIDVNIQEFTEYAKGIRRQYQSAKALLVASHQQFLEIMYEDIVGSSQQDAISKICAFLGLENKQVLEPIVEKQNPWPLDAIVSNFLELEEELKGSEFESMLYGDEFAYASS
jgi:LPS sulfotransferase NodH